MAKKETLQVVFQLTDKPIVSINPSKLKDHPLNIELFGNLEDSAYDQLKEDIEKRGIQDPLHITKDNVIVSGHQRRLIAQELGMDVPCIIRNDLEEEWQIEEQLISDNLLRRHLSPYQQVECDDKLKNIEDIKAKLRKESTLPKKGQKGFQPNDTQNFGGHNSNKHSGESLQKRAKKLGTNRETLRQARKVYYEAPEPIKKKWKNGKISTHKAYKKLQSEQKKQQIKEQRKTSKPLPTGKFSVVYADPPWRYDFSKTTNRDIENQYPTMTIDEIKNMDLPEFEDDAVLYLWATAPKLIEAIKVMKLWGFTYKTHAIWNKQKIGMVCFLWVFYFFICRTFITSWIDYKAFKFPN